MNEQYTSVNEKKQQMENEIDDVIKKRIYSNGVSTMTDELRAKMIEIISSCMDMAISTAREDGWPQTNTVGFVNMGEDIYFETFRTASKAKNIARDNRVSVAIWPYYESVVDGCGISLAGCAEEVTDEEIAKEFHRLLLEKMPVLEDVHYRVEDDVQLQARGNLVGQQVKRRDFSQTLVDLVIELRVLDGYSNLVREGF